ncbi:hypothetical protein LTR08_005058 [Meristemomyces frigidus]|nr:hypothetical protein LTR08_005058 [Meristemomyces frigidus]
MAAQLSGTRASMPFDSPNTKQPSNVNDADLHPDMTEPPVERQGATEMIFCLTRAEVAKCWQRTDMFRADFGQAWESGDLGAIERVEADIDAAERDVESKFLRYCDFIEPTQCLTIAFARSALTRARLRLRLPRAKAGLEVTAADRSDMSKMAMKILDYDIAVRTNPALNKYLWHMQAYFQYEPLIWILNELREGSPAIVDPESAWARIEQIYACHPEFITTKRALHAAVAKLIIKAWEVRSRGKGHAVEDTALIAELRSSFVRKGASRTDSSATTFHYNPFAPHHLSPDLSVHIDTALTGSTAAGIAMEFSPADIDWTFWDELIRAPTSLAVDGADDFVTALPI